MGFPQLPHIVHISCWVIRVVFRVHVRLSVMCTPRNFALLSLTVARLLRQSGVCVERVCVCGETV